MVAFSENPADFLNDGTPGYAEASWNSTTVPGIFEDDFQLADLGGALVEGTAPVFHCTVASVPAIKQGDAFTVNSKNYKVGRTQPDGTGWTVIILEDAA